MHDLISLRARAKDLKHPLEKWLKANEKTLTKDKDWQVAVNQFLGDAHRFLEDITPVIEQANKANIARSICDGSKIT